MDDLDRLIARLKRMSGTARVGALDEENATKLAYAEFGTPTAPARPPLSAATDRNEAAIFRAIERRVAGTVAGTRVMTGEETLAEVAADLLEEVVAEIESDIQPPLAPSTLANRRRRGVTGERSLVDTGAMRDSIKVETSENPGAWPDDTDAA